MGECAWKSHMNSAKHKLLSAESTGSASAMQLTAFFEKETHAKTENVVPPAASNGNETETLSVPAPPMKTNPAHGSMMDFVRKNDVLRAEVLWTLHTVSAHYSYKSNENVGKVFQAMFPDSVIASKFSCGEKKTAYLCVFGVADHFKETLMDEIKGYFVILFDESLNKKSQQKQMDIHVRYWNGENVTTRYLGSQFLGKLKIIPRFNPWLMMYLTQSIYRLFFYFTEVDKQQHLVNFMSLITCWLKITLDF